ncbi:MAG: N-acetylmuramoyl-L-alanine amidase [Myxococcota bacterium]
MRRRCVRPRRVALLVVAAVSAIALALSGCDPEASSEVERGEVGGAASWDEDRIAPLRHAERMRAEVLPSRAAVVGLTERLGISAESVTDGRERGEMLMVAGQLRERLWRHDGRDTDAREAMELYGQVAEGPGVTVATRCAATSRRALLHGEFAGDAARSYRELYLALESFAEPPEEIEDDEVRAAVEACVRDMRRRLRRAQAFRPVGAAWAALQRRGADLAQKAAAFAAPSGSIPPSAPPVASAPTARPPTTLAPEHQVVVTPEASLVTDASTLEAIRPYNGRDSARIVLRLARPATYTSGMLGPDAASGRGHRLFLDVARTAPAKGLGRGVDVGDGLVERVRVGRRKGDTTRVVVDLADAANRRIFYLPNPFRIVVDVARPGSTNTTPGARDADEPSSADRRRRVRRITLDPGHGGWDAGAVGPTGLREKDVALDIAHRTAPILAGELGIETMLTRDTDVFVELEERTAKANAFQSDLFVSIHCNATENGEASGYEVFVLDPSRDSDRRALRALARENHAHPHGGTPRALDVRRLDAQVTNVAAGLGLGPQTEGSRRLADLLRRSTRASLSSRYPGIEDHGTKTAGFYVLVGAAMPAVLYETSFISNPGDEANLGTADYRQKFADAIVNAVRAYTAR